MNSQISKPIMLATLMAALLSACDDNNNRSNAQQQLPPEPPPVMHVYRIHVANLTASQPMSPLAVIMTQGETFWQIGQPASLAIEALAEGGDNSSLLALESVNFGISSEALLLPGETTTIDIEVDTHSHFLTLATMLVNTNDGFTGLNGMDLTSLAVGESVIAMTKVWDAGTEDNSEQAGSIPGPADGGEGVNSQRSELDKVTLHPGVVSVDAGLTDSVLNYQHRFDNPALKVVIERLE